MTTTMADMVANVRRTAYGSMSESRNYLAAAYTAGDSSISLELDVTGITPGTILSCGLNTWYVKEVTTSTNSVSVAGGEDGAPEMDAAIGARVLIRPRVTDWWVFDRLKTEIKAMSSPVDGLYKIGSWLAVADGYANNYPVPTGISLGRIARVRWLDYGTPNNWIDLGPSSFVRDDINGLVRLTRMTPAGASVQFIYTSEFTEPVYLTDDPVADCGLSESMLDIPVLGAVSTLLLTTEARRNQVQAQGDPRRADEVQTGGNTNAARFFRSERQNRVNDEYARLVQALSIRQGT